MDIGQIQTHLNYIWVLSAAAIVFLMQSGFMCLEAGISPAKHSINVAIKNMADFVIAVASFWAVGFGLMFGLTQSGLFGTSDFFISADDPWQACEGYGRCHGSGGWRKACGYHHGPHKQSWRNQSS